MSELQREYIYQEIREQPAIARALAGACAKPWPLAPDVGPRRTVVTGAGDSLCAAELCGHLYPDFGLEPLPAFHASELALSLGTQDALIGISVSGRTTRVVEAALRARARAAHVVAVTDDPAGPLAEAAHEIWLIGASPPDELTSTDYTDAEAARYVGYHHDVAQTKTFVASVLTLAHSIEALRPAGTDWSRLADLLEQVVEPAFVERLQPFAEPWARAGQTFVLGSRAALPLARFGAYKMFEYNRIAHFADLEEYCHTHYFVTREGDAVVFVLPDAPAVRRAAEIAPVLEELFDGKVLALASDDLTLPAELERAVRIPAGGSALERHLALVVALEWSTYLCGRIDAPNVNTFHAGYDTERLVAASMRTIRNSEIVT